MFSVRELYWEEIHQDGCVRKESFLQDKTRLRELQSQFVLCVNGSCFSLEINHRNSTSPSSSHTGFPYSIHNSVRSYVSSTEGRCNSSDKGEWRVLSDVW